MGLSESTNIGESRGGFASSNVVITLNQMLGICYEAAKKQNDYKALLEIIKIMQQNNLKELQL